MRVIVEDDVFEQGMVPVGTIITMFHTVLNRKHGLVFDINGPMFKTWLSGRDPYIQRELRELVRLCAEREAQHPSDVEVQVLPGEDALKTAEAMLTARACVFLENDNNDWHFLMAVATHEARSVLKRAKDEELLDVVKCGGLGEMSRHVDELRRGHQTPERKFAMMDSDRLYPNDSSSPACKVRREISDRVGDDNVRFLNRRAIENYLPEQAIIDWSTNSMGTKQSDKEKLRRCYVALLTADEARSLSYHYNLKTGLNGDHRRIKSHRERGQLADDSMVNDPEIPDEFLMRGFEQLPSDIREGLRSGLSKKIAEHYTSHHQWYLDNDNWCPEDVRDEFTPFIMRVIRAL